MTKHLNDYWKKHYKTTQYNDNYLLVVELEKHSIHMGRLSYALFFFWHNLGSFRTKMVFKAIFQTAENSPEDISKFDTFGIFA